MPTRRLGSVLKNRWTETIMNGESSDEGQLGFSVSVAARPEGGSVVTVFGELDVAVTPALRQAFEKAMEKYGEPVVVDMRACSFVDSSGIATLVGAARRLHDEGSMITIQGAQERVRRILDLAGLASNRWIVLEP